MNKKKFYKELLYLFGSHSNYDEIEKKFNQIYELYNLKFKFDKFYSNQFYDFIPFEGKIPNIILKDLEYNLEINNNIIKTTPIDFISILVSLHDFYSNLYHDGNVITLKGKEKSILIYAMNKLTENLNFTKDVNKLNDIINDYYEKIFNNKKDILDIKINDILKEIDDHNNLPYYEYVSYKEIFFNNTNTFIREYRNESNSSLMNYYFMNTKSLENILEEFNKTYFNKIKLESDNNIEITRYVKYKDNNKYNLSDFNKGVNTINIIFERNIDGYKKLSYNLNTHNLIIQLISDDINIKSCKIANGEDKNLLLELFYHVNEKIDNDIRYNKSFYKSYR